MPKVKLCYAFAQVGNVMHTAFRLCDADKLMPDGLTAELAHEIGVNPTDLRLSVDCTLLDIPESVVERIRKGKA